MTLAQKWLAPATSVRDHTERASDIDQAHRCGWCRRSRRWFDGRSRRRSEEGGGADASATTPLDGITRRVEGAIAQRGTRRVHARLRSAQREKSDTSAMARAATTDRGAATQTRRAREWNVSCAWRNEPREQVTHEGEERLDESFETSQKSANYERNNQTVEDVRE